MHDFIKHITEANGPKLLKEKTFGHDCHISVIKVTKHATLLKWLLDNFDKGLLHNTPIMLEKNSE